MTDLEWLAAMADAKVPRHLREGLTRYFAHHVKAGDFLMAVLENDLTRAVFRADDESLAGLLHLMRFLHNDTPFDAWGSRERVTQWLAAKAPGETNIVRTFNPEAGERIVP